MRVNSVVIGDERLRYCGEVSWERGFERERGAGPRVEKAQPVRVQSVPTKGFDGPAHRTWPYTSMSVRSAVEGILEEGKAKVGELCADLVSPPRVQLDTQLRYPGPAADHLEGGVGAAVSRPVVAPRRRQPRRESPAIVLVAAMPGDEVETVSARATETKGEVLFGHLPGLKRGC